MLFASPDFRVSVMLNPQIALVAALPRNVPAFETTSKPCVRLDICEGSKRSQTGGRSAKICRGCGPHPYLQAGYVALQLKRCGKLTPLWELEEAVGSSKAGRARALGSRIELPGMARATAPQQRGKGAKRLPRKRVSPPHLSTAMQDATTGVKSDGQGHARLDGKSDFAAYLAASEACWDPAVQAAAGGDVDERSNRSNGPTGQNRKDCGGKRGRPTDTYG